MDPNINAEVDQKAETFYDSYYSGVADAATVDRQFIAIIERIHVRVLKILKIRGADLTSFAKAEEIDSLVADMRRAAERFRWLVQGRHAPGPTGQVTLLLELGYLEFAITFGRVLRAGAELNARLRKANEGESRLLFLKMLEKKAALAALLVLPDSTVRPCPQKFARAWDEYCNVLQILAIRFGDGGHSVKA